MPDWLEVTRGEAPLIVSMPHTGTDIPADIEARLVSPWLARKDADWHIEKLYDFAPSLGATTIRTAMSRTVIDVNRDPSGASLYPGQATTELCPTTTFDGELLYRGGWVPDEAETLDRRARYFDPYHAAIRSEIDRLKATHEKVVLFEAHSIRSLIPRLFAGELPNFNIGTNSGASCDPALTAAVEEVCRETSFSRVTNGRFKGGWITRHYGNPAQGVHAIQMELSCRSYLHEPDEDHWGSSPKYERGHWPPPYEEEHAAPIREAMYRVLHACIRFAGKS